MTWQTKSSSFPHSAASDDQVQFKPSCIQMSDLCEREASLVMFSKGDGVLVFAFPSVQGSWEDMCSWFLALADTLGCLLTFSMQDCAVSVCHRTMLVLVPLLGSSYLHHYTCLSQLHTSATALHRLLCADLFKSLAWSAHANPEQTSSLPSCKIFWCCAVW